MNRLLKLAAFVCGEQARRRVFEPMLADWQRELTNAKRSGMLSFLLALGSGCFGFIRALLFCSVCEGVWIPPLRGTLLSLAGVIAAIAVSTSIPLIATPPNLPRDLSMPTTQLWVLTWTGSMVPPVFLLAAFLMRRDPRATLRHGIVVIVLAAAATSVMVRYTDDEWLRRRYDTFENSERMREFSLARHRAGQPVYRGSGYEREIATTVEQRHARFDRYRAQMAALRRNNPAPTWSGRVAQWSPVLLAVVFAITGWMLASFGLPTIIRGVGWWALMFAAIVTMTRMLSYLVGVPMPRPPQWVMLPIFTSIMLALIIGARHIRKTQLG